MDADNAAGQRRALPARGRRLIKRSFGFLLALLFTLACRATAPVESPETSVDLVEASPLTRYEDGYFFAVYPDWPPEPESAAESEVAVASGGSGVWIQRFEALPRQVVDGFEAEIATQPDAEVLALTDHGDHHFLEYRSSPDGVPLRHQALLKYCQGRTYVVAAAGLEASFADRLPLFEEIFSTVACTDPQPLPPLETGKLAMVVTPADDDPLEGFYPAYRMVKETGVQVIHTYLNWGEIEQEPGVYTWDWQDYALGLPHAEGFEISLVINVIHTTVRGGIPEDIARLPFDDPKFIQRFTTFILVLLDRYPGYFQYLSIGNEVNDYFVDHRDEVEAYRTFFLAVKKTIAATHPDVSVAMTFAYHDAERQGGLDLVEELNIGDFLPVTLYLYDDLFRFTRRPEELADYFPRLVAQAGDKPLALVEMGWNTAASLDGTQADQAAFVRQALQQLAAHQEDIAYMTWFNLHDSTPENCETAALTFIPHRPDLAEDQVFMTDFVDFLCYLGLREHDGTPKQAWGAWLEAAETYLEGRGVFE
jgi:hypothetical protein